MTFDQNKNENKIIDNFGFFFSVNSAFHLTVTLNKMIKKSKKLIN